MVFAVMGTEKPVARLQLRVQRRVACLARRCFGLLARLELAGHLPVQEFDARRVGECFAVSAPGCRFGVQAVIYVNGDNRDASVDPDECVRKHGRIESAAEGDDVARRPSRS